MSKESKEKERLARRKVKKVESLPLEPINYKILIAGVVVILVGYFALGTDPWDGFIALTVAPILLLIGYCVLIPAGIMYRAKKEAVEAAAPATSPEPGAPQPQA